MRTRAESAHRPAVQRRGSRGTGCEVLLGAHGWMQVRSWSRGRSSRRQEAAAVGVGGSVTGLRASLDLNHEMHQGPTSRTTILVLGDIVNMKQSSRAYRAVGVRYRTRLITVRSDEPRSIRMPSAAS